LRSVSVSLAECTSTGPLGLDACLGSAALAQVIFSVSGYAVFLPSFFRFDVLV
jgi:hypothetical protein